MTVRRGETIGIVGESGSGKSMLVRSIMGIAPTTARVDPTSSVRFDGRDVLSLSQREAQGFWGREIAMVFQDPLTSLNPIRTIGRQITDPLRHHLGLNRRAAADRAVELLERVRQHLGFVEGCLAVVHVAVERVVGHVPRLRLVRSAV